MRVVFNFAKKIDFLLFLPATLLTSFGLLMIYSVSFENDVSFFFRQLSHAFIGISLFFIISQISFKKISQFTLLFYILMIVLLVGTLFLGEEIRGSTRWIDLGVIKFQASEIAKPILVLSLAFFFANYKPAKLKNVLVSILLVGLPVALVILQPDLGNSLILLLIWLFLIFLGGINILLLFIGALGSLVASPFLWNFLKDYQKTRILSFINPAADSQNASYNVVQSLIALGSGQMFGRGLGRGTQSHLDFLPAESTDFIFAAAGEELGFIGISLLIALFCILIYRLVKLATSSKRLSTTFFVFGTAFTIFIQFFVNVGVNMGILPVTGITLPFVSFGGSSLISMFIMLGLVNSAENSDSNEKFDTVFDS